ncbi:hypothetical protein Tco_1426649, partial [Tanacetum coccineum]
VSDNEDEVESPIVVEKKTVVPTIPKVDVVKPKQQEKSVRKTVRWKHRLRGGKSAAKTKDNDERQRISRAEGLIQELLQKIFIQAERSRR